jgi:hypothetical protein
LPPALRKLAVCDALPEAVAQVAFTEYVVLDLRL